jgi:hypothetical protein
MVKLISLLDKNLLTLIVFLPENSMELAKAAQDCGADAIVLNIDPESKDKKQLIEIIKSSKLPVGARITGNISEQEIKGFNKLGIDFFDISLNEAPGWLLRMKDICKIAALDPEYMVNDLTKLADRSINGIDAAIISESDIGKDLTVGDLQQYITIALSTGLPVIVPTQKLIRVSEVPIIFDTGAKAIMINDIVAGTSAKSIKAVTKEFKEAIEALKK